MLVLNERRGRRRREALLDVHGEATVPASPAGPDPIDVERLGRCLEELDERARTLLLLTFYADRSSDEVAGELRTSAGNVRVVRHRSVEKLRKCMEAGSHA
jgi:RNA polymerase sigma-70 factor (ECF subfamily)